MFFDANIFRRDCKGFKEKSETLKEAVRLTDLYTIFNNEWKIVET